MTSLTLFQTIGIRFDLKKSFDLELHVYTQLRSFANSLVQVVEIHQGNFEGIVTELREIRGLRTESQNILKHLFARQENGE